MDLDRAPKSAAKRLILNHTAAEKPKITHLKALELQERLFRSKREPDINFQHLTALFFKIKVPPLRSEMLILQYLHLSTVKAKKQSAVASV